MLYSRLLVLTLALIGLSFGCAEGGGDTASFDYAIREHFFVPEPGDLEPESGEVYTQTGAVPSSWVVDFNACSSKGDIVEFDWSVDGAPVESHSGCRDFSHTFDSEGIYQVELTTRDADGVRDSVLMAVEIEDILIVGLGDSYAQQSVQRRQ